MRIVFHQRFKKEYKKLSRLRERVNARIDLFVANPFNPVLNNHPLHGKWNGHRSINISGDYRAIYQEADEDIAHFIALGTHNELYP